MVKGSTITEMFSLGGGTCWYMATRSTVILSMVTQAGGRDCLVVSLYHTFILVQSSFTIDGSKAKRELMLELSVLEQLLQSVFRLALIWQPFLLALHSHAHVDELPRGLQDTYVPVDSPYGRIWDDLTDLGR